MLIGILSDTHDHIDPLRAALQMLKGHGAEYFIHCGDVGGERVLDCLAGLPCTFVWGNNDYDTIGLEAYARNLGLTCADRAVELVLGGKAFFILHGDDGLRKRQALESQQFDYLLQGHTHVYADERIGRTRIINPGALFRTNAKSVALLDTKTDGLQRILVA